MFQERKQQFECDQCHTLMAKSQPVRFDGGHHFCSMACHHKHLDNQEALRRGYFDEQYYNRLHNGG